MRRAVVLLLVTALVAQLTTTRKHPDEHLDHVRPASVLDVHSVGDKDLDAVPAKIEAQARQALMQVHDLDPGDPRLNGHWADDEIRGLMLSKLLDVIETPDNELDDVGKQYYSWFQHVVRDLNVGAAEAAIGEYQTWKSKGCSYEPPGEPEYDPGHGCDADVTELGGPIVASAARLPQVDQFRKWGVERAAINFGLPDLSGDPIERLLLWGKIGGPAAAGAVVAGVGAATYFYRNTPFYGFSNEAREYQVASRQAEKLGQKPPPAPKASASRGFGKIARAGGRFAEFAPIAFGLGVGGAALILVLAIIALVLFIVALVQEGELQTKLNENLAKARELPDLRSDAYKSDDAIKTIIGLFALQLPPEPTGAIDIFDPDDPQSVRDNPDRVKPTFEGSGFVVQPYDSAGSPADEEVFVKSQSVKLADKSTTRISYDRGWLVREAGRGYKPMLSIDYLDWDGNPRRALIRQNEWLDNALPKNADDFGELTDCQEQGNCPGVDTLKMLDATGNRITLKTRVNHAPPPVTIGAPDTTTVPEGSTVKLSAEGIEGDRDADGDPITYRWAIETGCAVTPEYLDKLQNSIDAMSTTKDCFAVGQPGSGFNGPVETKEGRSVDVTWADNGTRLVRVEASDGRGLSSVAYRSFKIDNVAPKLHIASSDFETENATVTGCIEDPGGPYEFPGLTVDWGDGTIVSGPTRGVSIKLSDKTGTAKVPTSNGFTQVTVLYVDSDKPIERIDRGMTVSFEKIDGCTGTYSFKLTHNYARDAKPPGGADKFPVTITASDGDGGGDSDVLGGRAALVDVTISNLKVDVANKRAIFRVKFGAPVRGFDASDLVLTGVPNIGQPQVVDLEANDAGVTEAAVAVPMKSDGSLTLSIPAGAAKAGERPTAASRPESTDSDTIIVDLTPPTARISSTLVGDVKVTREREATFALEFSEPVKGGVSLDDLELSGTATRGTPILIGSSPGQRYVLTVPVTSDGNVSVALKAGTVRDIAGNVSGAATSDTVEIDQTPPTVTVNQADDQSDPTGGAFVNYSVEFSEPVDGLDASDFHISGTAQIGTATLSAKSLKSYTLRVPVAKEGIVDVALPVGAAFDHVGNGSGASFSQDRSVTVDRTRPEVWVSKALDQPDPTQDSDVRFRAIFTEPVTGFDASDVSLSGTASHGDPVVTGSDREYTVTVPVMSGGTITPSVRPDAATDDAGNPSVDGKAWDATVFVGIPPNLEVTAHDKKRAYGAADPKFTVTFHGFVNGDGPDVLARRPCTTTAEKTSPVGSYPITCPEITADTYQLMYVPGTLRITKAPTSLAVTALVASAPNVSAKLTMDDDQPVAGNRVSFRSGSTLLCSAITDADGVATCTPSIRGTVTSLVGGVTARFAGTKNLRPSTGRSGPVG